MADCPKCGSILKYDIPSGNVTCTSCRSSFLPEQVDFSQNAEEDSGMMGVQAFYCPNCGGEIFSTDRDITGVCSYCGSWVVFESRLVQKQRPEYILPFQKTKEDCKNIYLKHLGKNWFVPKELKDDSCIDSFRGIYMPYWLSTVKQEGQLRYYASDFRKMKSCQITNTYRVRGELEACCHHLYHDAGSAFSDDISEKLEPYQLKDPDTQESALKPFYPSYLSGFYAEPADLEFSEYEAYFEDLADRHIGAYLDAHPVLNGADVIAHDKRQYQKLDLIEDNESEEIIAENLELYRTKQYKLLTQRLVTQEKELEKKYRTLFPEDKEKTDASEDISYADLYGFQEKQEKQLAMFPVWFLSWKNGKRVAYVSVNGQTGKVSADLPIDLKRFFFIFALLFAACFAGFSLFTTSSYTMPVYAIWFSAIAIHMSYCELNRMYLHAVKAVVHEKRTEEKTSEKVGTTGLVILCLIVLLGRAVRMLGSDFDFIDSHTSYCLYSGAGLCYALWGTLKAWDKWKELQQVDPVAPIFLFAFLASAAGGVLVFLNIPIDELLYGGAALAFGAVGITLLGMVLQFNKAATRPLPQFEHKGGDDRA